LLAARGWSKLAPSAEKNYMAALPALPFYCQRFESALGEWEFLIAPPPPDLAGIVECFWISRGRATFVHEKILPQNNIELMFNLCKPFGVANRPPADRSFRRAWVAGMQREWLTVTPQYDPSEASYLLSVRMPPLGAYRLLGIPLGSVAQNVFELDSVLGEAITSVHQRLGECTDVAEQFAVLCDFARGRMARSRVKLRPDAQIAVDMLTRTGGVERIENICRSVCVSRKHLNNLFDTHIGLTPKTYARMFRFRRVVDLVQRGHGLDWTRVALSCGYYDQAHFNHEFREFSGMSPGEYAVAGSHDGLTVLVT
jgi:AraC-like DNA-binding protein